MNRKAALDLIEDKVKWDVLVIGGGASGLGTALDSASRGYKTLLIEQLDFAHGTSSRSTKLIHGGIRYLPQGRLLFVRKALKERAILMRNAPHLIHPLSMILPSCNWFEQQYHRLGIKLYDWLAGNKNLQGSRQLSLIEMRKLIPTLSSPYLNGGTCFFDGQFDDARLAICLAQSVIDQGGSVVNYMKVKEFIKERGKVNGVVVNDLESGLDQEILAKVVINATGRDVDALRKIDNRNADSSLLLSQGTHIVLEKKFFPSDQALVIPSDDGRIVFVIPWHQRVLIGTTDIEIDPSIKDPKAKKDEIEYLIDQTKHVLTSIPKLTDICSMFTGVRALLKSHSKWKFSSKLAREHAILVADSQLVSLLGGKWTTYRQMGEETMDIAAKLGGLPFQQSKTRHLQLHGWAQMPNLDNWQYYGSDLPKVNELGANDRSLLERMHPSLPCRGVDVIWAVRNEMARTLEDVLSRRSRSLLLGARESIEIAPQVASIMAAELQKDKAWEEEQIKIFQGIAEGYLPNF